MFIASYCIAIGKRTSWGNGCGYAWQRGQDYDSLVGIAVRRTIANSSAVQAAYYLSHPLTSCK
jgi:hypothetical protein